MIEEDGSESVQLLSSTRNQSDSQMRLAVCTSALTDEINQKPAGLDV